MLKYLFKANLLIYFLFFLFFTNCNDRPSKLEIIGNQNWFSKTKEDSSYFLNRYHSDFKDKIDWPPNECSRKVDISVDVTGSSYMKKVEHNGQIISLTEYNLKRLCDYLKHNTEIKWGDVFYLRLFGENKAGINISPRELKIYECPKINLELEGRILTRRYNDLQIKVNKINYPDFTASSLIDKIYDWYLPFVKKGIVRSGQYMKSPLFEHIYTTINYHVKNNSKELIFIYVTDGWAELDEFLFWPKIYIKNPEMVQKIKEKILSLNLKPFKQKNDKIKIIFIGLNDGGFPKYREAQQKLFEWFFEPQDITLIYY